MCIIVAIPRSTPIDSETLYFCWEENPDGAGFSYYSKSLQKVQVNKGFMRYKNLYKELKNINISVSNEFMEFEHNLVIHFRWATHGGISKAMTHPFEIVGKKKELIAFHHNGMIPGFGSVAVSDTADFTAKILVPLARSLSKPRFKAACEALTELISSRTCFHFPDGSFHLHGRWKKIDGIWFSSTLYGSYGLTEYTECGGFVSSIFCPIEQTYIKADFCFSSCQEYDLTEKNCSLHKFDEIRNNRG